MMRARGVAARGGAAARCRHLLDAPARGQAPPRRAAPRGLGCDGGGWRGPLYPGARQGVLERLSPLPQCWRLCTRQC